MNARHVEFWTYSSCTHCQALGYVESVCELESLVHRLPSLARLSTWDDVKPLLETSSVWNQNAHFISLWMSKWQQHVPGLLTHKPPASPRWPFWETPTLASEQLFFHTDMELIFRCNYRCNVQLYTVHFVDPHLFNWLTVNAVISLVQLTSFIQSVSIFFLLIIFLIKV